MMIAVQGRRFRLSAWFPAGVRWVSAKSASKLAQEPMGYAYFSKAFAKEINLFRAYCEKDKTGNLETFKRLTRYKQKAANKERLSLFVATLKRNTDLYQHLVSKITSIPEIKEEKQPEVQSAEPFTIGSLLTQQEHESTAKAPKPATTKKSTETFKDLLGSINKIQKVNQLHRDLPKMTNFTPMPTIRSFEIEAVANDTSPEDLESFLQEAKHRNDVSQDQLFKSELNYEWMKQQFSKEPRTLETGNFFTPVLLPNTFVPSSLFSNQKSTIDLFPSMVSRKQAPKGYDYVVLHEDGSLQHMNRYNPETTGKRNVSKLMAQLRSPDAYIKHINKLISQHWQLFDGDSNKLVFYRKKTFRFLKWARNMLAVIGFGFVSIFGLSYFVDSDELQLLKETKDQLQALKSAPVSS